MGRALTLKLKELIPRQMFKIPIQVRIEYSVGRALSMVFLLYIHIPLFALFSSDSVMKSCFNFV